MARLTDKQREEYLDNLIRERDARLDEQKTHLQMLSVPYFAPFVIFGFVFYLIFKWTGLGFDGSAGTFFVLLTSGCSIASIYFLIKRKLWESYKDFMIIIFTAALMLLLIYAAIKVHQ